VIQFGLAAFLAMAGNIGLIDALFTKRRMLRRTKTTTLIVLLLLGMGVGTLGTSVYLQDEAAPSSSSLDSPRA
jgi:hypothetical protein